MAVCHAKLRKGGSVVIPLKFSKRKFGAIDLSYS